MRRSTLLLSGLCLATVATAQAATFTPTRYDDPLPDGCSATDCSLREAVMAANAAGGFDTIMLKPGSYLLTRSSTVDTVWTGDLDVTDAIRIEGTGSSDVHIVNMIAEAPYVEARLIEARFMNRFELEGLTLSQGRMHQSNTYPWGGCLWVDSAPGAKFPKLVDVVLSNCRATQGGGVFAGGPVRFKDVRISDNRAAIGGGVWQAGGRSLWRNVIVTGNSADVHGGGLVVVGAGSTPTIIEADAASEISYNTATYGGGVASRYPSRLVLSGPEGAASTGMLQITYNIAQHGGGAWSDVGAAIDLRAVNLQGNQAESGGAISSGNELRLQDSQVRGNSAAGRGGGIESIGRTLQVQRVSLDGNTAASGGGLFAQGGVNILLRNVSVHANAAFESGGLRLQSLVGTGRLEHVSMHANDVEAADGSEGLRVFGSQLELANNWFGEGCKATGSTLVSLGGNAQPPGTAWCSLNSSDVGLVGTAAAAVSQAAYGGRFAVIGFAPGTSVLEDRIDAADCAVDDARSRLRQQHLCDVGAFEAAGVAP